MSVMNSGQALLSKASGGALGSYPSFGMSMRFAVEVYALLPSTGTPSAGTHLGLWQSCKNLQVELKYKPVEQGGVYTQLAPLPERIAWPPITLERAVQRNSSHQVWQWLQSYIDTWTSPTLPAADMVVITLLDYQLNRVLQWELQGAYPIKWVGPSLSATENKVAIEQLVLEHQGFKCITV